MNPMQNLEKVRELLNIQAELLINVGTGKISIRDTDSDLSYQENDRLLVKNLKKFGLSEPFPWRTLWEWHGFYRNNLPDYASRREHIGTFLRKSLDKVDEISNSSTVLGLELYETKVVVQESLVDAEVLIREGRLTSAIDRLHTAMHGHLKWICESAAIDMGDGDASVMRLMKLVRENHPNFTKAATLDEDLNRMFLGFGNILDSLNRIRNNASPAHPNEILLSAAEARLAVNVASTILNYLDDKVRSGT